MTTATDRSPGGARPAWGTELMASVVVFLVALPLCMGIAIASGVPPALGLITGIVGGIVVGVLAGAPLQVSGPAAGLTVLVWQLVSDYGLVALGVAVLLAGALQVVAGLLRIGRWFRAVSPALIQGMLAGIGVLIFASQFHVMVDDKPRSSGWENLLTIPSAVKKGLIPMDTSSHHLAALIGFITIVTIVAWTHLKGRQLAAVPGALIAVLAGTAIANLAGMDIQYVAVPENLSTSLNIPTMASFGFLTDPAFVAEAVALAFIASAETLLCATAVDRIVHGARTNYDRELVAQGVGNMLCGAVGALPMTGVIVRSSANVGAGAKTRASAILHGVWLLALVVVLPSVLLLIPTASLAAILVYTGYRLMNPVQIKAIYKAGRGEALVFAVTVGTIVATDLLTGVLVGLACSIAKLMYTVSHVVIEREVSQGGKRVDIWLHGAATFVRLPVVAEALESLPHGTEVHIHIGALAYIDHACLELLHTWETKHKAQGGTLVLEWDALRKRTSKMTVDADTRSDSGQVPVPASGRRGAVVGA